MNKPGQVRPGEARLGRLGYICMYARGSRLKARKYCRNHNQTKSIKKRDDIVKTNEREGGDMDWMS